MSSVATKEEVVSERDQNVLQKMREQSSFMGFFCENKSDSANVVCSWIVFVGYGIAMTYIVYGYGEDNDSKKNSEQCEAKYNGYASGPYGSGAFPISMILFIVANFAYVFKLVKWIKCPDKHERKRRADEIQMIRRQSSSGIVSE